MSFRGDPMIVIISIAQQARPKPSGNIELPRAQFCAFSSVVVQHARLDVLLEVLALELALQQLARLELADAQVVAGSPTFWRITSIRAHPFARRR